MRKIVFIFLLFASLASAQVISLGGLQISASTQTLIFPTTSGSSGNVLSTNGSGTLSWVSPGAASMAIGSAITSGTSGSILYVNSSVQLAQDNANFFWDATNHRLGLGTTSPSGREDLYVSEVGGNGVNNMLYLRHNVSSGTAAAGDGTGIVFQNGSTTTADRNLGYLYSAWQVATDASRKAKIVFGTYSSSGGNDVLQLGDATSNQTIVFSQHTGGILATSSTGVVSSNNLTAHGVTIAQGAAAPTATAAGTSRQLLVSGGGSADPLWTTETYAVPGTAGNALVSDGTNWTAAKGWINVAVSGSDFTTSSTTPVDITGLSFTAVASTNYFIDVWIDALSSSSAGVNFAWNSTGTSPTGSVIAQQVTTTNTVQTTCLTTNNSQFGAASTGGQEIFVHLTGWIKSGTGSPTISIRMTKITSGTGTIRIGSFMNYRAFP